MKTRFCLVSTVLLFIVLTPTLSAKTIYVNSLCGDDNWTGQSPDCSEPNGFGPMASISMAAMSADMNDTIVVADGIYMENGISTLTDITLQSENGPDACIIDGMNMGSVFSIEDNTIIDGFTIINGESTSGGAIFRNESYSYEPCIIRNCIFANCRANSTGGAIHINHGPIKIINCAFINNYVGVRGGAIFATTSDSLSIDLCHFENNGSDFYGGAISLLNSSSIILDTDFNSNYSGNAEGLGGAISCHDSTISMNYCDFENNTASEGGGAIYSTQISTLILSSTNFSGNKVLNNSASGGGAIMSDADGWVNSTLTECIFNSNFSSDNGGAIAYYRGWLTLKDCILYNNTAENEGGAIFCNAGNLKIVNSNLKYNTCTNGTGGAILTNGAANISTCDISGNKANMGSAIYSIGPADMTLQNCLITGNLGTVPSGTIQSDSPINLTNTTIAGNSPGTHSVILDLQSNLPSIIRNSILWNDSTTQIEVLSGPSPIVSYSNFYCAESTPVGDCVIPAGVGNISIDPLFASPGYFTDTGEIGNPDDDTWIAGDYHLRSRAGRWEITSQSWVYDDVSSPCIDAGDPLDSVGDEPFANGERRNMGAYGGTDYASKSPGCLEPIPGDTNNDCKVDFEDFAAVAAHWMECNIVPQKLCW